MGQLNATGYYSLNTRSVISFLKDSRQESIISFARRVRKNNLARSTIIVVHNLKSHKGADMKAEAKGLGIGLVSLPPYCLPDPDRTHVKECKERYVNEVGKACE